jgi:hypothetical protein
VNNAAVDIRHDDPEFGYRFIADELAGQGVRASRSRVNWLCTDSVDEMLGAGPLEEPVRAGLQSVVDDLVAVEGSEDENARAAWARS